MSEKARDGVCDKHGKSHDIANLFISDGSQFTTGAAENPTLNSFISYKTSFIYC